MLGTQFRVFARVMSPSDLVRAVGAFGIGYTYEAVYAPDRAEDKPTGHGFCANIEPGVEIDVSGFFIGLHTPFAFSITVLAPALEISGGIRLGYGDW